MYNFLKI